MSIQVTPIPRLTVLAAPAFTLGTANAAGSATSAVASDSTLLTFDAVVVSTNTYGASSAAGSAVVASRRDHVHGMPDNPALVSNIVNATRSAGAGAGDQTIEGFGFQPTTVQMMLVKNPRTNNGSYGWGDDDEDGRSWDVIEASSNIYIIQNIAYLDTGGSDIQYGTLKEYTSDGLIITWTQLGSGVDVTFSIMGMR